MAVYALGSMPVDAGNETLVKALEDAEPDVQWNAAIALARHGRHEGVPVLRRMLDRAYVERNVTRQPQARDEVDPVGEVMISGLRAIAALKEGDVVGAGESPEHRRSEPEGAAGGDRSAEDARLTTNNE